MKEWFTALELCGLSGLPGSESGTIRRAKRDNWQSRKRSGRGGGKEYHITSLPPHTQAALAKREQAQNPASAGASSAPTTPQLLPQRMTSASLPASQAAEAPFSYDRDNLWLHFDAKPDKQKDKARYKLDLLLQVMTLVEVGRLELVEAMKQVGGHNDVSWRTMQGWYHGTAHRPGIKLYDRSDWLAALVPGYVGRTAQAECPDEAWETFKADYLRLEKPSAKACYNRLKRTANDRGWELPSMRTIHRRIDEIPRTIRVLRREGEQGLLRLYPAQERTVRDLHAMQWINGDGYQHNVFVRWPNGDIERPKTWFWQDVYSRKILSYRVDVTENIDSIRLSFGDLIENYGPPDDVTIDNTRAAANKYMTGGVKNRYRFKVKEDDPLGLIPSMGCRLHWTSVHKGKGHGQAKPIERAFGVGGIGEVVDKHPALSGAYTGHNTTAKPENYGSKAVPIETFLEVLREEITAWNAQEGRRTEICAGKLSFDQAFNISYSQSTITKVTEEQRRLWLLSAEAIKVQRDGTFTLDAGGAVGKGRNRYHNPELFDHAGQKIVVRFDPQNLHGTVYAYTLDNRYICEADCLEATGFGDTEAARSFNRHRKQFMRATKAAAKAESSMTAIDVADQLPATTPAEVPDARVVRPLRPEPSLGRPVPQPQLSEKDEQDIAAFEAEFASARVYEMEDDPNRRFERWSRIEQRIERGESVSDEDRNGLHQYMKTSEYQVTKAYIEEFGLEEQG